MAAIPAEQPQGMSVGFSDQARLRSDKLRAAVVVAQLARKHSIRTLAAGGPMFAQLGLVSPRVSPTALVLVEPKHQLHLVLALEGVGWSRISPGHIRGLLPPVFTRVVHPDLVCPLDIYDLLPGFYAAPAQVFELFWTRRVELQISGIVVPAFDRVSTVLVAGHDQLGALARDRRAESQIAYFVSMFRTSLTPAEQAALVQLVTDVRGIEPLRPFLTTIGVPVGEITLPSEIYCQVRLVLESVSDPLIFAVSLFEARPGRRKAGFVRILRNNPRRVVRALLASPRSFVIVARSRARHQRQQQARPPHE